VGLSELALVVDLSRASPPAGTAAIENRGPEAVRLWRTSNTWGAGALRFELTRSGASLLLTRRPEDFTRNVPSAVEVPAGGRHELPFDLGDGGWEGDEQLDRPAGPGGRLVAVYEVGETPEAAVHGVWTGRLKSEPVSLNGS
jgi:hypothetical protein